MSEMNRNRLAGVVCVVSGVSLALWAFLKGGEAPIPMGLIFVGIYVLVMKPLGKG
ncbi:hypothetical protein [Desulfoluna sp.]|uniref:hypothetical protein n=1 Tax=Desulfoluna sp. TaxID=2045199 RepID=UPI0026306D2D|nr:hypothetical protein [Desulfoluna sp.]